MPGCPGGGLSEAAFPGPPSHLGVVWLLGSAMWGTGGGQLGTDYGPVQCPGAGGWWRAQQSQTLSGAQPGQVPAPLLLLCQCCSLAPPPVLGSRTFLALEWGRG